eukprot:TRINITY_DN5718_c0_g2_i1.p1 TRINITY_DN5718_c0_g2~~TRINITY_DN5718_c0_g2_i1.p1  ORF type:complete len:535 (+),score=116.85 TRINITY_DN5718_c0_g2_i1:31-1635(+)
MSCTDVSLLCKNTSLISSLEREGMVGRNSDGLVSQELIREARLKVDEAWEEQKIKLENSFEELLAMIHSLKLRLEQDLQTQVELAHSMLDRQSLLLHNTPDDHAIPAIDSSSLDVRAFPLSALREVEELFYVQGCKALPFFVETKKCVLKRKRLWAKLLVGFKDVLGRELECPDLEKLDITSTTGRVTFQKSDGSLRVWIKLINASELNDNIQLIVKYDGMLLAGPAPVMFDPDNENYQFVRRVFLEGGSDYSSIIELNDELFCASRATNTITVYDPFSGQIRGMFSLSGFEGLISWTTGRQNSIYVLTESSVQEYEASGKLLSAFMIDFEGSRLSVCCKDDLIHVSAKELNSSCGGEFAIYTFTVEGDLLYKRKTSDPLSFMWDDLAYCFRESSNRAAVYRLDNNSDFGFEKTVMLRSKVLKAAAFGDFAVLMEAGDDFMIRICDLSCVETHKLFKAYRNVPLCIDHHGQICYLNETKELLVVDVGLTSGSRKLLLVRKLLAIASNNRLLDVKYVCKVTLDMLSHVTHRISFR